MIFARGRLGPACLAFLLLASCAAQQPAAPPSSSAAPSVSVPLPPADESFAPLATDLMAAMVPGAARPRIIPRNTSNLDPFFADLASLETGVRRRVNIVQIGDSHTAGDVMSARLRELLQQRFGAAGRGWMPPGKPYPTVRHAGLVIQETGRWAYEFSLNQRSTGPFSLAGIAAKTGAAGASLALDTTDERGFDEIFVALRPQQNGGRVRISVDGRDLATLDTSTLRGPVQIFRREVPSGSRSLRVTTLDRKPVTLLGWGTERAMRGVVYDSLGVVGASYLTTLRWDEAAAAAELASREPSLVILVFGTNEGFRNDLDGASYTEALAQRVRAVHAAVPNASILVVGPPDAARKSDPRCQGLACNWATPANIGVVRDIQIANAPKLGYEFWDWWGSMGGADSMRRWVRANPPLARADHVHFTTLGYSAVAERLYEDLMANYDAWNRAR
jgi:lysophospholipase L1-like esterase